MFSVLCYQCAFNLAAGTLEELKMQTL